MIDKLKEIKREIQEWWKMNDMTDKLFGSTLLAGLIAFVQMIWNFGFGDLYLLNYVQTTILFAILFVIAAFFRQPQ